MKSFDKYHLVCEQILLSEEYRYLESLFLNEKVNVEIEKKDEDKKVSFKEKLEKFKKWYSKKAKAFRKWWNKYGPAVTTGMIALAYVGWMIYETNRYNQSTKQFDDQWNQYKQRSYERKKKGDEQWNRWKQQNWSGFGKAANESADKIKEMYEQLGLDPTKSYTKDQLHNAWKSMAKVFHPDRIMDPDKKHSAQEKMKLINAAYDFLKQFVS